MKGLTDKRIGVAADRKSEAISKLIENMGGSGVVYPSQGKQVLNEDTSSQNVKDYLTHTFDWVILTTGIGARTLTQSATDANLSKQFLEKLSQNSLAIRGSKTMDWLKENNLKPSLVSEDGTMDHLFSLLPSPSKEGASVFLQAYHQDDALLKNKLEAAGYTVYLSQPYAFEPPSEYTMNSLKEEIVKQSLDAVVFTSKTQVKNIFETRTQELTEAFNDQVLAVAVGKVTAKELEDQGIKQVLQPSRPKMGAMVVAMDRYYQKKLTT
ncbi:uroporphyrinogen-III synthase [Halobacillus mangrovi]|uniref:Uroporphyrinogen-III synthase n=1 Tax=Halobacillus mangrovi TaxID=402384 RepID=A0A1W5ZVW8_9BACI|nr:uroporphyrinogen-III synthase [Halobacillus mangrovi]ARI77391.1 uroporphyrinogen-III synthase [Halobacillus mangrovi]